MQKYVAFLRGINVGGNKKVPMAELKKILEKIGLKNVKTLLASGNVVFEADSNKIDELQTSISSAIEKAFKFRVPVLLRSFSELQRLVALDPFKKITVTPQTRLYVTFLTEKVKDKTSSNFFPPNNSFTILSKTKSEVFSVLDLSITGTPEAMGALEKEFGKEVTTRNWNTILKIAKLKSKNSA